MFLDTSIIVELMRGEDEELIGKIMSHIENELIFISMVQLGEVNDWCLANCSNPEARISQLREIVHLIPVNETICIRASEIKHEMRLKKIPKFSLIDGLILASARHIDQKLLTLDSDFRKAKDAICIQ
jgi:predicted nucleic acid-binding protein